MPMVYERPDDRGALRQGEIVENLWEHRGVAATGPTVPVQVRSFQHPLAIVLTADCDLEQDFTTRFHGSIIDPAAGEPPDDDPHLIHWVLVCDLFSEAQIRQRVAGSDVFKRVRQGQDERYHRLPAASIEGAASSELPDLFIDFKRVFALPTAAIYQGIARSAIVRRAIVPSIYIHDLMHRFYGFLSRVGIP